LGQSIKIDTPTNPDMAVSAISKASGQLAGKDKIDQFAVGAAGVFNETRDTILYSPHLPEFSGYKLKKFLEKETGAKVVLENDAALGGLGEATYGAGRRKQVAAFLTFGTGVGGVRIVDGKIDQRAMGFEPGHQIISASSQTDYWEEFVSGTAMEKIYGKPAEEITDEAVWDNEARLVALGLQNVIVMWSPHIVILGGALTQSLPLDKTVKYLKEMLKIFPQAPPIVKGELGDQCGLYGGLALLRQESY
jgi:predicted NBD/HSP70 family sugar kinase